VPLPGGLGQARDGHAHGRGRDLRDAGELDLRLRDQPPAPGHRRPVPEADLLHRGDPLFRSLGIFLPLITTNCAILGLALFQTNKGYGFAQCVVYALGAGTGFTLALVLMAGLREKLDLASVPDVVRGTALALVLAGILSVAFMGFAGLGA
jgi:hypothetical protein